MESILRRENLIGLNFRAYRIGVLSYWRESVKVSHLKAKLNNWWKCHNKKIYAFFRLHLSEDEAWDLYQETFIKAFTSIERSGDKLQFESDDKFTAWMMKVAYSVLQDYRRKRYRWKFILERAEEILDKLLGRDVGSNPESKVIESLHFRQLLQTVEKLSSFEKNVIILRLAMDMSFKEISEVTNKSINTCLSAYYRGLRKVANYLKAKGKGGESL